LRAESRSADEGVYGGDEVGSEVVVAVNLASARRLLSRSTLLQPTRVSTTGRTAAEDERTTAGEEDGR
jgi:hypothetical protein